LTFEGIKMKAKDKVIGLLEKNLLPFAPEDIRWVIEAYGLEAEDEEVLTQEVVAEGLKRTTSALHAFFESVGHPPLPKELAEVEETLRKGGTVRAWCLPNERTSLGRSSVTVEVEDQRESRKVSFPGFGVFGELYLRAFTGVVGIETSTGLEANSNGWAFFKAYSEETIEEALRTAISLRPVLSAMAIPDLEYALIDLRDMEEGGRWIEGSCTLIRDGQVWVLKRGSLVGDPDLDRALLRGELVTLSFPEDVEIAFKAKFFKDQLFLVQGYFRFGEEVARFGPEDEFSSYLIDVTPVMHALQWGLSRKFKRWEETGDGSFFEGLSSRTIVALKTFAELRDPFWLLAEGRFHTHVTTQLFLDL
jgi:hypothetical protein